MFTFRTKPQGIHATLATTCYRCQGELTVTSGRVDKHECLTRPRLTDLEAIQWPGPLAG